VRRFDRLASETGAACIRVAEVVEMDSPSARNSIASRSEDAVLPCLFLYYSSQPESFLMHTRFVTGGRCPTSAGDAELLEEGVCVCVCVRVCAKYPKVRIWTCSARAVYFTGSDLPCVQGQKASWQISLLSLSLSLPLSLIHLTITLNHYLRV